MKIKYIEYEKYLVIFNIFTNTIIRVKDELRGILPLLLREDYSKKECEIFEDTIVKNLDSRLAEYLSNITIEASPNISELDILTLTFAPVYSCNLRCTYCYADSGDSYQGEDRTMDIDTIEQIIKFMLVEYMPKCKFLQISLVSGGEPFLDLSNIVRIDGIINKYRPDIKRKIFIATNGTIYNNKIENELLSINPQLGISIDGPRKYHDINRVDTLGRGTYDTVINTIDKIKNSTLLSKKTKNIILMTVITEDNLDLVEILENHRHIGVSNVQMKIARSSIENLKGISENNIVKFKDAYLELTEHIIKRYYERDTNDLMLILNGNDTFGEKIISLIIHRANIYVCGAGRERPKW